MTKLASIYQRRGTLFILASHRTEAGFWVDDELVTALIEPTIDELGQAIIAALARSRNGVPTPPRTARLDKPLLKAAKVSSWAGFMNQSKLVGVCTEDDSLKITPYRNLGRKEGFEPNSDLVCQPQLSAFELGELVSKTMAEMD